MTSALLTDVDPAMREFAGLLAAETDPKQRDALLSQANIMAADFTPDDVEITNTSSLLRQRLPLGDLFRTGVPEPTFLPSPTLGERLFYEGSVGLPAGHKKAGKSWGMTLQARDMMLAERPVIYVDNENGENLFTKRLTLAGGLTGEHIDEFLHYIPFPREMGSTDLLYDEFSAMREELPGAFVVLDSLRSYLARFKLNPEKNVEVEEFFGPIMAAVKSGEVEGRLTVAPIDHSNRNTKSTDDYVASGAAAKAQAVDAVYFWEKLKPFSQDVQGVVRLSVKDDRQGMLDFVRHYKIGGQGAGQPLYFAPTDATAVGTDGRILEDVRQWLADHAGEAQTKTEARKAIKGDSTAIDRALDTLAAMPSEPIYTVSEGKRPPKYIWDDERPSEKPLEV